MPPTSSGNAVALRDLAHERQRIVAEAGGGIALVRFYDVYEMVRGLREGAGIGLGGANVHALVDLRGIHADDLARQVRRQRDRDGGLAAGCGAQQQDGRGELCDDRVIGDCRLVTGAEEASAVTG